MEKISNIVRGNARVAAVDLKSGGAVRPGALSFGRPIGESGQVNERGAETTASKAANLQSELNEAKKARSNDRVVSEMADSFFMTRVRRPDEQIAPQIAAPAAPKAKISAKESVDTEAYEEIGAEEHQGVEMAQPSGYVPRGSYVNVTA